MVKGFKQIFEKGGKCEKLRTDRGTEFVNKQVKNFLAQEDVHHFVSENPSTKASIAERAIRTIKMKMYKYMNEFQTFKYITALPKIITSYNNTFHRSIQMKPSQVTAENQSQVWRTLHGKKHLPLKKPKLTIKVGDWVRVSNLKGVFDKSYRQTFSGEIFQVVTASVRQGKPVYTIKDYAGEAVTGTFYPQELQVIRVPENAVFRVERVIRTRKLKNRPKQFLVRWLGWGPKWDSWVTEDELRDLPRPPE